MKVVALEVQTPGELEETFKAIVRERPGALLLMAGCFFLYNRLRIMDFATKPRLSGVHAYRELVEAGGLLVINLKAAKALGLTSPQSVLLRATEMIQ